MKNLTQFFKEEKDIFIQNVSSGQVSMQFQDGEATIAFKLERKRDPIVLTNHVPFTAIARSMDFRKLINRHPAIVKLMTEDEYKAHYASKAKQNKTTTDTEIDKAEQAHMQGRSVIVEPVKSTAPKDTDEGAEEMPVSEETAVHARVIHLCHQASASIPAADRLKPAEFLQQLKDLEEEFKMGDFEYIMANTSNKSVKTWATQHQARLSGEAEAS